MKSTRVRQKENEDAWRDFDGFDPDKELDNIREALLLDDKYVPVTSGGIDIAPMVPAYSVAAECFHNLSVWLERGGRPPKAWDKRGSAQAPALTELEQALTLRLLQQQQQQNQVPCPVCRFEPTHLPGAKPT